MISNLGMDTWIHIVFASGKAEDADVIFSSLLAVIEGAITFKKSRVPLLKTHRKSLKATKKKLEKFKHGNKGFSIVPLGKGMLSASST